MALACGIKTPQWWAGNQSIERMAAQAYTWEKAEIGRLYDVVGFLNYLPKRHFLGGREWGERKTYHLKLYNSVHQMIDVFVETKSMKSEVFLNIATNFQGALIYIEDCEALSNDTFQVDRTNITLTCVNFRMNKSNFKKFEKHPSTIFEVDMSLSTNSVDTFIVPSMMQDMVLNAKRLSNLRKRFFDFPPEKLEKVKNIFAKEIFHRENHGYLEQKEINEKIFTLDPFKYLETSDIVPDLRYNHCGIVNSLVDSGDEVVLTVSGYKFCLKRCKLPGVCERIRVGRLICFPYNVVVSDIKNIFSLKTDLFLTLVDDMESLSSVFEVW